jgi:hypothetical protein
MLVYAENGLSPSALQAALFGIFRQSFSLVAVLYLLWVGIRKVMGQEKWPL